MTDTWATSWAPVVSENKKPLKLKARRMIVGALEGISIVVGQKKIQVPLASNKSLKQLDVTLLEKNLESIEPFCIWRQSGNETLVILNFNNLDPQLAVEETKNIISYNLGQFGFCPINQDGTKRLLSPPKTKYLWEVVEFSKTWSALVEKDWISKSKQIFCSILQVVSSDIVLNTAKLSAITEVARTGLRVQDGKIKGLLVVEAEDEDKLSNKVAKLLLEAAKKETETRLISSTSLVEAWSVFEGLPQGVNK